MRAQHLATDIWEAFLPRQRSHPPILFNPHWVLHEVALHIHHLRRDIACPVVICHLVHPLHALLGLWPAEALLHCAQVLRPKRHPVPIHLQMNSNATGTCVMAYVLQRYLWCKEFHTEERHACPLGGLPLPAQL